MLTRLSLHRHGERKTPLTEQMNNETILEDVSSMRINRWGAALARDAEAGSPWISFSTLLLLAYKSVFAEPDIWTTGNLSATGGKDSRLGW